MNGQLTVTPAMLTLAGFKTYDSTTAFLASTFGTAGTIAGVNGQTLNLTGSGSVGSANVNAGTQSLTLGSLTLTNGTGLASNYQIASKGNTGTVTQATVTLNGTKVYDGTTAFAASTFGTTGTIATGINNELLNVTGSGTVGSKNVDAGTQGLALGTLALANDTGLASNYKIALTGNSGMVTPGTLAYTALPSTQTGGVAFPINFPGTVTGFISGETQGNATIEHARLQHAGDAIIDAGDLRHLRFRTDGGPWQLRLRPGGRQRDHADAQWAAGAAAESHAASDHATQSGRHQFLEPECNRKSGPRLVHAEHGGEQPDE